MNHQEQSIPPYVNEQNEFAPKNLGRYYYFFHLVLVEDLAALVLVFSLFANLLAALQIGADNVNTEYTRDTALQQSAYTVLVLISIWVHIKTFIGIQNRQQKRQRTFLVYTAVEVIAALYFDIRIIYTTFVHNHCEVQMIVAGSILSFLAVAQVTASHFVWENLCYLEEYVYTPEYLAARATALDTNNRLTADERRDLLLRQLPPSIHRRRRRSTSSFYEMEMAELNANEIRQTASTSRKPSKPKIANRNSAVDSTSRPNALLNESGLWGVKLVNDETLQEMRERIFGGANAIRLERQIRAAERAAAKRRAAKSSA